MIGTLIANSKAKSIHGGVSVSSRRRISDWVTRSRTEHNRTRSSLAAPGLGDQGRGLCDPAPMLVG
jgi:hypothetical protein